MDSLSLQPAKINLPTTQLDNRKKVSDDPLHQFPLNSLPYSNSVGVLVGYVAPNLGRLFWAPTLMYYGADVYDKYKNDKENNYNPSKIRGFNQVVFQSVTNLIYPLIATGLGSKMVSMMSLFGKDNLSIEAKEYLLKHHYTYATHCDSVNIFADFVDEYKKVYHGVLGKHIHDDIVRVSKNPLVALQKIFLKNNNEMLEKMKDNMFTFIDREIDEMFNDYALLSKNQKPDHISTSLFNKFQNLKKHYARAYENNASNSIYAIYDILRISYERKMYKLKMLKMFGGLALILSTTKPVNDFVKDRVMKKVKALETTQMEELTIQKLKEDILK